MPKELTHWILAERALDGLGSEGRLRGTIQSHRNLYLAGAVLPDTLLHLFRGPHAPTALALAHRFHDSSGNSHSPLIRAESLFPGGLPPGLMACLLGVVSHMQADSVFHPFVYALSGDGGIGRHYRLETAIDVRFLRRGAHPPARRMAELVTPATWEILVDACGLLFDPDGLLPRRVHGRALELHCRFQGMYDRAFCKLAVMLLTGLPGSPLRERRWLFYPLGAAAGGVLAELETGEWRHPVSGELINATPDDLAEETVRRTVAAFERIEAQGSLAAALSDPPGVNLLTGMFGVGEREMGKGTLS